MMWQPVDTHHFGFHILSFETKEECLSHAVTNKFILFAKMIEQYEGQIPPQQISCVPEKGMEELLKPIEQQMQEDKVVFEYKCKMVKVVDGDTVDVDIDLGFGVWLRKQRIRLYGIDIPESRTSDDVEKVYGFTKDF